MSGDVYKRQVYVELNKPFEKKDNLTVRFDGSCFKLKDSTTTFRNVGSWKIKVAEYGVFDESFEALDTVGGIDMITVKLGGAAVRAEVYPANRFVAAVNDTTPDENGQVLSLIHIYIAEGLLGEGGVKAGG